MWPIVLAILRRNAVYITLPIAGVIGFIGYNLESLISDKYTPYSPSIQDLRAQRLAQSLSESTNNVEKLSVLERNLSPSLQPKAKV